MVRAEELEQLVEFDQRLGDHIGLVVPVAGVVDVGDAAARRLEIGGLVARPQRLRQGEEQLEAGAFLPRAVAELEADRLVIERTHRFEQRQLVGHQPHQPVDAIEQGQHAHRLARRHMTVDLGQGEGDQLHPQLLDLVDDLELQLVGGTEVGERLLATQQAVDGQVDAVILHLGRFDTAMGLGLVEHGDIPFKSVWHGRSKGRASAPDRLPRGATPAGGRRGEPHWPSHRTAAALLMARAGPRAASAR